METPRKETTSTSSPRLATAASKTAPATLPPSALSPQAKATAAGSQSRRAPAAGAVGPGQEQGAKQGCSQPRPTASRGARGAAGDQDRASAGSCSAAQKQPPDAKGAAGPARPNPRLQKQQPGADPSGACRPREIPGENQDISQVEKETRGRWRNPRWYKWQENCISASAAPSIAKCKFVTGKAVNVPQSYLKAVVGSVPGKWVQAVQAYETLKSEALGKQVQVEDCGLFIHREEKWLVASPHGVVKDVDTGEALGLLEVKFPRKHRNMTVREACLDKKFCLKMDGDSYALKKHHPCFIKIQCQLAAANFQRADFVVHTTKETAVVPVEFDSEFWDQTMLKLKMFYTEAVIPHLEEKAASSARAKEE